MKYILDLVFLKFTFSWLIFLLMIPSFNIRTATFFNIGELPNEDKVVDEVVYFASPVRELEIPPPVLQLEDFINYPLQAAVECPDNLLNRHQDYIHYLYRLLVMGLLFEAHLDYLKNLQALNLETLASDCTIDWPKEIQQCSPSSLEMKKFKGRAYVLLFQISKQHQSLTTKFSASQRNHWFKQLYQARTAPFPRGITQTQLLNVADKLNIHPGNLNDKNIVQIFNQICQRDLFYFRYICSEQDELYGLSQIPQLLQILVTANTFKLINDMGKGSGCLTRFTKLFSHRERRIEYFSELLMEIARFLQKSVNENLNQGRSGDIFDTDIRYLQGRLFLAGALKEFDNKGLDDFIFTAADLKQNIVTPNPSPVVKLPTKIVLIATPIPNVTVTNFIVPTPSIPVTVIPTPPTPVSTATPQKLTAFIYAYQIVQQKSDFDAHVDMEQFKIDYSFSPETLKQILPMLERYKSQNALRDMCVLDKLGSYSRPLALSFIKLLLDLNEHHGLFNIQNVLGDKFYVENDLEKMRVPVAIKLLNREEDGQWQLVVLSKKSIVSESPEKTIFPLCR